MNEIIDFHTHILPGIDDGSQSIAESLELLHIEWQQGIRRLVLTPHFYPQTDSPERFLSRRSSAVERLSDAISAISDLPEVHIGAEVHYFRGMSDFDALSALTIGNTRCILIEMPSTPWQTHMYDELADIQAKQGLVPILAHIDRYIRPFSARGIMAHLDELPVLVQANASFFLKKSTSRMALRMLKNGQIHLLGSDCHNMADRMPNLAPALDRIQLHLGPDPIISICKLQDEIFL